MRHKAKRLSRTVWTVILPLLIGLATVFPKSAAAENPFDLLIVVNLRIAEDKISIEELREIFLKQRQHWKSGGKVVPINAPPGTTLRNAFVRTVLKVSPAEEISYWQDLKIKYGAAKPPVFSNTQKAVFKLHGGISYVFRRDYTKNVSKVVLIIPAQQKQ